MNCFCWVKKGAILAVIGTTFLGACSAQAQEAKTWREMKIEATPNQAQDRFWASAVVDDQLDPATLSAYRHWTIARLQGPADDLLGATMQPVGDALRAQLDIPAGQGLVVEGLRGEGASAQAGLQQNDILLSLADKPLGATDDLIKQLKAAGDSPAPLKILRGGKPVTIAVRPIYRVTLGPVGEQKTEYYIGISVVGLDDALRAQLGLTNAKAMIVSEVEKGSPAEKAGVKKWDIVLQFNGLVIDSPETLQRQVQAAQDRSATLKVLRAGKPMDLSVSAGTRKVEVPPSPDAAYRLLFLNHPGGDVARYVNAIPYGPADANELLRQNLPQTGQSADANDLRQRLDHLEKELTAVRAALDKINETLKANQGNKR